MKLFRNLRRGLIAEGRLKNYLAYAFGEILLVVVGILIALQINAWNAERQQRQIEREHLAELRADLEADLEATTRVQQFHEKKRAAIRELAALLTQPRDPAHPARMGMLMGTVASFEMPPITRIAFDNLVAAEGIGLISDRRLRRALTGYYSDLTFEHGTPERLRELTRGFVDVMSVQISREELSRVLGVESGMTPAADLDFRGNSAIWGRLYLMHVASETHDDELNDQRQRCRALIGLIDAELAM